jgi:hypothetical protein
MLTREQLKAAAFYLCKVRNQHPESQVIINTPSGEMGFVGPLWENVARDIEAHELLSEAIKYGEMS